MFCNVGLHHFHSAPDWQIALGKTEREWRGMLGSAATLHSSKGSSPPLHDTSGAIMGNPQHELGGIVDHHTDDAEQQRSFYTQMRYPDGCQRSHFMTRTNWGVHHIPPISLTITQRWQFAGLSTSSVKVVTDGTVRSVGAIKKRSKRYCKRFFCDGLCRGAEAGQGDWHWFVLYLYVGQSVESHG